MRHRSKKVLKIRGLVQKSDLVIRTLMTNLLKHGHLTTTEKKAKVLVAHADSFLAKLVAFHNDLDEANAKRETFRLVKSRIFGNEEGKKVVREILPALLTTKKKSGFLSLVKLGKRIGDGAEQVRVEIIK